MNIQHSFNLASILCSHHTLKWATDTLAIDAQEARGLIGELLASCLNGRLIGLAEGQPVEGKIYPPRLLLWHKGLCGIPATNQEGGQEIYCPHNGRIRRYIPQPAPVRG